MRPAVDPCKWALQLLRMSACDGRTCWLVRSVAQPWSAWWLLAGHRSRARGTIPNRDQGRPDHNPPGEVQSVSIGVTGMLNRADVGHLEKLREVVVPESWGEELSYSVLPMRYASHEVWPTSLVVYLPGQLCGAYEFGILVRWGPVSSGSRNNPTSAGRFALNWRSTGRSSTVDPEWFMPWYFNFANRDGLAFHAYPLPGYPASHGCIRLLARDAQWLFEWGQTWMLDPSETRVLSPGTPVFIVGRYDFDAAPPWRSLAWLSTTVDLAKVEMTDIDTPERSP